MRSINAVMSSSFKSAKTIATTSYLCKFSPFGSKARLKQARSPKN
jgi:hypothetical protein